MTKDYSLTSVARKRAIMYNIYKYRNSMTRNKLFNLILSEYELVVDKRKDLYLNVYDHDQGKLFQYQPLFKYDEKYNSRILYRLYNLFSMPIYYWLTLTVRFDKDMKAYDYYKLTKFRYRKMWSSMYNYLRVYNDELKFIRVFELTKNNILHVHIAFYSPVEKIIEACKLHYKNFGFFKLFKYENYRSSDKGMYADKYEYWVTPKFSSWKKKKSSRMDYKLSNYIMKYMLKAPSKLHRAVFWFFSIRTYSVSRNMPLNKFTRKLSEKELNINHTIDCHCGYKRFELLSKVYL